MTATFKTILFFAIFSLCFFLLVSVYFCNTANKKDNVSINKEKHQVILSNLIAV